MLGCSTVPFVYSLTRRDNLLEFHEIESEFLGYANLINFHEISLKHNGDSDKPKGVGKC